MSRFSCAIVCIIHAVGRAQREKSGPVRFQRPAGRDAPKLRRMMCRTRTGRGFPQVTGAGRSVDDPLCRTRRSPSLSSPHAHARISAWTARRARRHPGCWGADRGRSRAAGIGTCRHRPRWRGGDGAAWSGQTGRRFARDGPTVGQAEGTGHCRLAGEAADAAEKVGVDYEALPAVTDAALALAKGRRQLGRRLPAISPSNGRRD